MRKLFGILFLFAMSAIAMNVAQACDATGYVYCDVNQNGVIDAEDTPFAGVLVTIVNQAGWWSFSAVTDANGFYSLEPSGYFEVHTITLDPTTLPADAAYVHPPNPSGYTFELGDFEPYHEWLIDSATCREGGRCWMTGGGLKYEPIADLLMAVREKKDTFGGVVFPSCDSDPSDGGQWNHISHNLKLHFQGWSVDTVSCGNVPGIEPGSESPVTPYNFIEFWGTGTLKGITGNKVDYGEVHFFGRCEDRNEPASDEANGGEDIDRYFLQVYSDPLNPAATTLLLIDQDGDPTTVDPVLITGGNLQLHASSCDE